MASEPPAHEVSGGAAGESPPRVRDVPGPGLRPALIGGTLLGVALSVGLVVLQTRGGEPAPSSPVAFDVQGFPVEGSPQAPVQLTLFEDFKCPACATFEREVMPQIREDLIGTGRVKVVTVVWPFLSEAFGLDDNDSARAAAAGFCVQREAGDRGFLRYKTALFAEQGDEREAWATASKLRSVVTSAGLGDQADAVMNCVSSGEMDARVAGVVAAVGATAVTGTPTVVVGDRVVQSPRGTSSWGYRDVLRAVEAAEARVD